MTFTSRACRKLLRVSLSSRQRVKQIPCWTGTTARSFSTTSFVRASNHKTYFQPGDSYGQNIPRHDHYYNNEPLIQQPASSPSRQQWPTWRIVLLTIISTLVTTYFSAPTIIELLYSQVSPELRYLADQTKLHALHAGNLKELWNAIFLVALNAPNRRTFFDSYQDMQLLRDRPLILADGTKADESNAVLVRVVDVKGRTHMIILAVDTEESDEMADVLGADGSWMSNRTPIQKWMIALEMRIRREQMARGEGAGVTLVYLTRDTMGVGAFGPIQMDSTTGEVGAFQPPDPEKESLAMMHCVRAMPGGWSDEIFAALQMTKHEAVPLPELVDRSKENWSVDIRRDGRGLPSVMVQPPGGTGEWREIGRGDSTNAVKIRKGAVGLFVFEQQQDDGTWREFARFDKDALESELEAKGDDSSSAAENDPEK